MLTGSNVCFEPKRLRGLSDAASGDAAIGPPAMQQGVTGITFLSISRTPIARCVNRFTYGMRAQT